MVVLENHPQTLKGPREALLSWRRITSRVRNWQKSGQFDVLSREELISGQEDLEGTGDGRYIRPVGKMPPPAFPHALLTESSPDTQAQAAFPSEAILSRFCRTPSPGVCVWGGGRVVLYRGRELLAGFRVVPAVTAQLPWASRDSLKTAL